VVLEAYIDIELKDLYMSGDWLAILLVQYV